VAERLPLGGIKHSGEEWAYLGPLVKLGREKNFSVLVGADVRLAEAMAAGADGCIGGLVNVAADLLVDIFNAVKQGAPEKAQLPTERMKELARRASVVSFPLSVAAAMEARGLPVGQPRTVLSASTRENYRRLVGELRQLFREWKLT